MPIARLYLNPQREKRFLLSDTRLAPAVVLFPHQSARLGGAPTSSQSTRCALKKMWMQVVETEKEVEVEVEVEMEKNL
jgi:hypothetical protein